MTERTAYKLSEVRAALGISRSTLYRWIEDGKLPITKLCGRSFVRPEHLAGLMERVSTHLPTLPSKRDVMKRNENVRDQPKVEKPLKIF